MFEVTLKADADARVAVLPGAGSVRKGETVLVTESVKNDLDAAGQFDTGGNLTLGDEVPGPDEFPSQAAWDAATAAG